MSDETGDIIIDNYIRPQTNKYRLNENKLKEAVYDASTPLKKDIILYRGNSFAGISPTIDKYIERINETTYKVNKLISTTTSRMVACTFTTNVKYKGKNLYLIALHIKKRNKILNVDKYCKKKMKELKFKDKCFNEDEYLIPSESIWKYKYQFTSKLIIDKKTYIINIIHYDVSII